jgi:hypothetical protein
LLNDRGMMGDGVTAIIALSCAGRPTSDFRFPPSARVSR